MKNNMRFCRSTMALIGIGLTMAGIAVTSRSVKAADFLYIGDGYDNTVKRFDANTGANTPFVPSSSGGLDGPRGLMFIPQQHTLVVANQNVDQNFAGEILAYNGTSGMFLKALVPHTNPDSPFAPRGIVARGILFVASFEHGAVDQENDDGSIHHTHRAFPEKI